jgi:hypothetical protein
MYVRCPHCAHLATGRRSTSVLSSISTVPKVRGISRSEPHDGQRIKTRWCDLGQPFVCPREDRQLTSKGVTTP